MSQETPVEDGLQQCYLGTKEKNDLRGLGLWVKSGSKRTGDFNFHQNICPETQDAAER